jgi:hypothetical protein
LPGGSLDGRRIVTPDGRATNRGTFLHVRRLGADNRQVNLGPIIPRVVFSPCCRKAREPLNGSATSTP